MVKHKWPLLPLLVYSGLNCHSHLILTTVYPSVYLLIKESNRCQRVQPLPKSHILSHLISSNPILYHLISFHPFPPHLSRPILSYLISDYLILSHFISSYSILSHLVLFYLVLSHFILSYLIAFQFPLSPPI